MKPCTRVNIAVSERREIEAYHSASRVRYWSGTDETVIFEKSGKLSSGNEREENLLCSMRLAKGDRMGKKPNR